MVDGDVARRAGRGRGPAAPGPRVVRPDADPPDRRRRTAGPAGPPRLHGTSRAAVRPARHDTDPGRWWLAGRSTMIDGDHRAIRERTMTSGQDSGSPGGPSDRPDGSPAPGGQPPTAPPAE